MEEEIRYADNGGVAIAYQVVGEGDIDLVYVPDWMSNLVYGWESARWRAFFERLAQPVPTYPVRQARHGLVRPWRALRRAGNADGGSSGRA